MDERNDLPQLPKGWAWTQLGNIVDTVEKTDPHAKPEVEFDYLDIASIDNTQQKIMSPKRYLGKDAPSRARQVVKAGDIIFSTVRTYLKNIASVPSKYDGQIASTGFCVIRPSGAINKNLIFLLTQTDGFLNPLNELQRGTSYPAVRDSDVFAQFIPLAPLPEQHRIVTKIEELFSDLDAGVESLRKIQAQLKRYRQAVLKAAVEGKLTAEWRKANAGKVEPASVLLEKIRSRKDAKAQDKKALPTVNTSELPELSKGWEWARLDLLFQWSNGKGLTKKQITEGKYPIYGGNGITGKNAQWLCDHPCLVIGRVGAHCGNVHLAPAKAWITDNAIYSSWRTECIHLRFYEYTLLNLYSRVVEILFILPLFQCGFECSYVN